ncbi:cation diffusion facilitator family transporter [Clostridium sp. DSM 8431]|uniref:cation diffusion facilitator family transporter n=1 Tax=Clostridium sp. DSM 8431 TaxID=1761781 RepID=UPI0008E054D8|nr:cation diffusion facilitator family transporter [Clostridium sp. DSM 8431]SFU63472.1 cation diffusion facilitator family transporter [Clostridium sp. DSM 8431]
MISKFLVSLFVKNNENIENEHVRGSYIMLGGAVGIAVNLILFLIKLFVGVLVESIAITADAFNNLSDAASSIITIIGFKLSKKPADPKHPFGYGRFEYISALIVAFMVMIVGLEFVKSSFDKIINPSRVIFEITLFILLIVSILLKAWLSLFNKYIGNRINSSALKASSVDALGDVFTSTAVAISFLAAKFTSLPIDGYLGALVAIFITISGVKLVIETINPLLGEAPDKELVSKIKEMVLSYEHIEGVHDLIIHNYGPGRCMASLDAEIPAELSFMEIHEIIDTAEREISKKLNIYLVIHMDPIYIVDEEIREVYDEVQKIITYNPLIKSIHDFRISNEEQKQTMFFHVVVDSEKLKKIMSFDDLEREIITSIQKIYPQYDCVITIDNDFI